MRDTKEDEVKSQTGEDVYLPHRKLLRGLQTADSGTLPLKLWASSPSAAHITSIFPQTFSFQVEGGNVSVSACFSKKASWD